MHCISCITLRQPAASVPLADSCIVDDVMDLAPLSVAQTILLLLLRRQQRQASHIFLMLGFMTLTLRLGLRGPIH